MWQMDVGLQISHPYVVLQCTQRVWIYSHFHQWSTLTTASLQETETSFVVDSRSKYSWRSFRGSSQVASCGKISQLIPQLILIIGLRRPVKLPFGFQFCPTTMVTFWAPQCFWPTFPILAYVSRWSPSFAFGALTHSWASLSPWQECQWFFLFLVISPEPVQVSLVQTLSWWWNVD